MTFHNRLQLLLTAIVLLELCTFLPFVDAIIPIETLISEDFLDRHSHFLHNRSRRDAWLFQQQSFSTGGGEPVETDEPVMSPLISHLFVDDPEDEEDAEDKLEFWERPRFRRETLFDAIGSSRDCSNDTVIVAAIFTRHDKHRVPPNTTVVVELWVQEVSKIVEQRSEFELDIYITESWSDKTLAFDDINPCKKIIALDGGSLLDRLWTPCNLFVNSKTALIHQSPVKNIFLMIWDNGTIMINYRMKLTGPCVKELRDFPIDKQKCSLTYESFVYNHDEVKMVWSAEPVSIMHIVRLPDYDLVGTNVVRLVRDYPPGRWDELVATFTFERRYGFYILQAYVPAYMTVFISWVSFFLGPANIVGRTTVGVNSLMALSYQFASVVADLPRTNDVKAIDVLILSCMGFIFCSLLEMAIVGYIVRSNMKNIVKCDCSVSCFRCPLLTGARIDQFSMRFFPGMFLVFNVWYWFLYLGN